MKQVLILTCRAALLIFMAAIFCALPVAAQDATKLIPIVDCITFDQASGQLQARMGYITPAQYVVKTIPVGPNNYFEPNLSGVDQPTVFYPGDAVYSPIRTINHNIFVVSFLPSPDTNYVIWHLDGNSVQISVESPPCRTGTITYQGKLTAGGAQATGNYDLQFRLYNRLTGGAAVGNVISAPNTPLANGTFTVSLDFDAESFAGGAKSYLEISVRPAGGSGAYTTLAPRQPVADAPAAVYAQKSENSSRLGGRYATNYLHSSLSEIQDFDFKINGDGTLNNLTVNGTLTATLPAGSANYIQNSTARQANSNFNISGNGTLGGNLSAVNGNFSGDTTANKTTSNGFQARGGAPGAYGANNNGYSFKGDTGDEDGGLFSNANGQVSLYTNSGERVRVTDSGLQIFGALTANTTNFKRDHPLDPLNKTLTYTSIESPDMKNIYDGNATTDANGEATVTMPDYFEALNRDFRYQLTVIGTFAQAIILEEIKGNRFKIKTDKPNVKVSWQITGIRRDKFAEDNRPQIEQVKSNADKNKCLYAPACRQK